jgi:hypothetical protein
MMSPEEGDVEEAIGLGNYPLTVDEVAQRPIVLLGCLEKVKGLHEGVVHDSPFPKSDAPR